MSAKRRPHPDDTPDSDILPSAGALPADTPQDEAGDGASGKVRLNKFLASQGVASRRKCDELILAGRVFVDGRVVRELGVRVDPATQEVEVDGQVFKARGARLRYYLLNKPKGVVCTNEERETRPRAVDLITDPRKGRIFTVGRLDEESEGLILITNDGDFAQRVMHPRYGVEKTYEVEVFGRIEDEALAKVREGVHLAEGRTAGARVLVKDRRPAASRLTVSIREGMNREIRRAFARIGHKVLSLRRVRIGPITDRGLKTGRWRELASGEVRALTSGGETYERPRRRPTDKGPRKLRAHSGKPGIARRQVQVAERLREREQRAGRGRAGRRGK
jgi:23S rRNA pseudouridine2605 synthase